MSHNRAILDKCKDALEREFYLRMTKAQGWSKNVLIHQIENQTYQKTLRNQTNFAKTLPSESQARAMLAVKDEYTFDFLESATSSASGSSKRRYSPAWSRSYSRWAASPPSSAASTGCKSATRSIFWISCCTIVACNASWRWN